MANITVSSDVDTMLQSADNAAIRSNIGAAASNNAEIGGTLTVNGKIESESGSVVASGCTFTSGTIGNVTFGGTTDVNQGELKAPDIVANEISCQGSTTNTAQPLRYFSNNHRFGDYDQAPDDLLVIRKFDGHTGARIGINKEPSASNATTVHIVAGENASTGAKDMALKVIGTAFFDNFVRVGHYSSPPNDAPVGSIIFNSSTGKFQGNVGNANGGWKTFAFES